MANGQCQRGLERVQVRLGLVGCDEDDLVTGAEVDGGSRVEKEVGMAGLLEHRFDTEVAAAVGVKQPVPGPD